MCFIYENNDNDGYGFISEKLNNNYYLIIIYHNNEKKLNISLSMDCQQSILQFINNYKYCNIIILHEQTRASLVEYINNLMELN